MAFFEAGELSMDDDPEYTARLKKELLLLSALINMYNNQKWGEDNDAI